MDEVLSDVLRLYDNCELYNTPESHPYAQEAQRQRAEVLLAMERI